MPFLDTNTQLTTKPYNFDIKCQSNSESYDRHGLWGPSLGGVRILYYGGMCFFLTRESTLRLTGRFLYYKIDDVILIKNLLNSKGHQNYKPGSKLRPF